MSTSAIGTSSLVIEQPIESAVWSTFTAVNRGQAAAPDTRCCVLDTTRMIDQSLLDHAQPMGDSRRPPSERTLPVSMNLDYDCADGDGSQNLFWETLDVQFAARSSSQRSQSIKAARH